MTALKQNIIPEIKISYSNPFPYELRTKITKSTEALKVLIESWDQSIIELHESFKILYLNRANQVLGIYNHSTGGTTGTVVDIKLILVTALKTNAHGVILAHNHPSGNRKPSNQDINLTRKIKEACKLLEIQLLDHLIITKEGFLSFGDEGLL